MADRAAVVNRFGKRQNILRDDDEDDDQMPTTLRRPFRLQAQMPPPKGMPRVKFFEPDDEDSHVPADLTFFLALHQIQSDPTISPWQLCSHYAAMVSALFPGMKLPMEALLNSKGVYLQRVKIPSQAKNMAIDTDIKYPHSRSVSLVYLGCAILILFKNLSPQNYEPFMSKRINALKSKLSALPNEPIRNPFTFNQAAIIRSRMGGSLEVKSQLIQLILQNRYTDTLPGYMCLYLAGILAWSEMQAWESIKNTLVLHRSPVLEDPSVQGEAQNLEETLEAMDATPCPEFFRFVCRADQRHFLHRSRVRILAETAFAISRLDWTDPSSPEKNLVTAAMPSDDRELIERLVKLHAEYIISGTDPVFKRAIAFLRNYE